MKRINKDKYIREKLMELLEYNPETGIFKWKSDKYRRDKENLEVVTKDKEGYITIYTKWRPYRAHRVAWLFMYGKFPKIGLDHINRIKDDNRIVNLREATDSQNQANLGINKNNTSGYPGVSYCKDRNRFVASIRFEGKNRMIGRYKTKEEAFLAYVKEKERLCGEFFDRGKYSALLDNLDIIGCG